MKNTFVIFLMTLSMFSYANDNVQNREGVYYDLNTQSPFSGVYEGKYEYKQNEDNDWSLIYRYSIEFNKGLRDGITTIYVERVGSYAEPSYKKSEIIFNQGNIQSMKEYAADFSLRRVTTFKNGSAKRYNQETGKLVGKIGYLESDDARPFKSSNKIESIMFGDKFAYDGEIIVYRTDGSIRKKSYKNNVRHGDFENIYSNGNIFLKGNYLNGKMNGNYTVYCSNGKLKKDITYLNGEEVEIRLDEDSNYCNQ
ncbi:toxin-antitoxin system YwqK family antitoxin [Vibrio sp. F74]|uniref:toxin-antitoxin system YwqK family antitoxin n=1 Tax=Vibrio sp. F74 TaxID=700020 RepID=UPI0035F5D93E